jgi:hypothetical protein
MRFSQDLIRPYPLKCGAGTAFPFVSLSGDSTRIGGIAPRSLPEGYPPGAHVPGLTLGSPFQTFIRLLTRNHTLPLSYAEIGLLIEVTQAALVVEKDGAGLQLRHPVSDGEGGVLVEVGLVASAEAPMAASVELATRLAPRFRPSCPHQTS